LGQDFQSEKLMKINKKRSEEEKAYLNQEKLSDD